MRNASKHMAHAPSPAASSTSRSTSSSRIEWRPTKTIMTMRDLAKDDDFLSHLLVEKLGTGDVPLLVHKMDPSRRLPKTETAELMKIVRHLATSKAPVQPATHTAVDELLALPPVRYFLRQYTQKQINAFATHASRYFELYHPLGSIEIAHTSRYSHKTGKSELCVLATRPLVAGQVIAELKGSMAHLTEDEDAQLKRTDLRNTEVRRDFSVIHSRQMKRNHLFLGPARFVNHDCENNCELFREGKYITFRTLRAIGMGEEITAHYGDSYFGRNNRHCLCESCEKNSRGGYAPHRGDTDSQSDDGSHSETEEQAKPGEPKPDVYERRTRRGVYAVLKESETEDSDEEDEVEHMTTAVQEGMELEEERGTPLSDLTDPTASSSVSLPDAILQPTARSSSTLSSVPDEAVADIVAAPVSDPACIVPTSTKTASPVPSVSSLSSLPTLASTSVQPRPSSPLSPVHSSDNMDNTITEETGLPTPCSLSPPPTTKTDRSSSVPYRSVTSNERQKAHEDSQETSRQRAEELVASAKRGKKRKLDSEEDAPAIPNEQLTEEPSTETRGRSKRREVDEQSTTGAESLLTPPSSENGGELESIKVDYNGRRHGANGKFLKAIKTGTSEPPKEVKREKIDVDIGNVLLTPASTPTPETRSTRLQDKKRTASTGPSRESREQRSSARLSLGPTASSSRSASVSREKGKGKAKAVEEEWEATREPELRVLRTRASAAVASGSSSARPHTPTVPLGPDGKPLPTCRTCNNVLPVVSVDFTVVWGLESGKGKKREEQNCPRCLRHFAIWQHSWPYRVAPPVGSVAPKVVPEKTETTVAARKLTAKSLSAIDKKLVDATVPESGSSVHRPRGRPRKHSIEERPSKRRRSDAPKVEAPIRIETAADRRRKAKGGRERPLSSFLTRHGRISPRSAKLKEAEEHMKAKGESKTKTTSVQSQFSPDGSAMKKKRGRPRLSSPRAQPSVAAAARRRSEGTLKSIAASNQQRLQNGRFAKAQDIAKMSKNATDTPEIEDQVQDDVDDVFYQPTKDSRKRKHEDAEDAELGPSSSRSTSMPFRPVTVREPPVIRSQPSMYAVQPGRRSAFAPAVKRQSLPSLPHAEYGFTGHEDRQSTEEPRNASDGRPKLLDRPSQRKWAGGFRTDRPSPFLFSRRRWSSWAEDADADRSLSDEEGEDSSIVEELQLPSPIADDGPSSLSNHDDDYLLYKEELEQLDQRMALLRKEKELHFSSNLSPSNGNSPTRREGTAQEDKISVVSISDDENASTLIVDALNSIDKHDDKVSVVVVSDDDDEDEVLPAAPGESKPARGITTPGISPLSDSTTLARLSCTSTPKTLVKEATTKSDVNTISGLRASLGVTCSPSKAPSGARSRSSSSSSQSSLTFPTTFTPRPKFKSMLISAAPTASLALRRSTFSPRVPSMSSSTGSAASPSSSSLSYSPPSSVSLSDMELSVNSSP